MPVRTGNVGSRSANRLIPLATCPRLIATRRVLGSANRGATSSGGSRDPSRIPRRGCLVRLARATRRARAEHRTSKTRRGRPTDGAAYCVVFGESPGADSGPIRKSLKNLFSSVPRSPTSYEARVDVANRLIGTWPKERGDYDGSIVTPGSSNGSIVLSIRRLNAPNLSATWELEGDREGDIRVTAARWLFSIALSFYSPGITIKVNFTAAQTGSRRPPRYK